MNTEGEGIFYHSFTENQVTTAHTLALLHWHSLKNYVACRKNVSRVVKFDSLMDHCLT